MTRETGKQARRRADSKCRLAAASLLALDRCKGSEEGAQTASKPTTTLSASLPASVQVFMCERERNETLAKLAAMAAWCGFLLPTGHLGDG